MNQSLPYIVLLCNNARCTRDVYTFIMANSYGRGWLGMNRFFTMYKKLNPINNTPTPVVAYKLYATDLRPVIGNM